VLKPGGRTAFLTIHVAPGLSAERRRRANSSGPPDVRLRRDYPDLMRSAGFVDVTEEDVTGAYLETARAWRKHSVDMEAELTGLDLPASFEERQANRRTTIAAIEDGLLRRSLYVGRRPAR